jgi:hypothetical protein
MPCLKAIHNLTQASIAEILDRAGEQRFLDKASLYKNDLAKVTGGQSLYQGIMTALGYS